MTSKNNQPGDAAPSADTTGSLQADSLRLSSGQALRRQAEAKLSERKKKAAALPAPETDTQRLIHELEVHQIELEMQNEELLQSRAQVEAGLRRYTDLYDFAPVGYFTLALDGAIHQVNLAGANLLGVERGALIKRRFGVFVSARSRTTFSAFLEKVFSTSGSKETCEVALQEDGAAPLWAHIEAMIEDGQRKTCRAVVVDITERKRAEEGLRDSEEKFKIIFDSASDGILIADAQNKKFLQGNAAICSMLGYTKEEIENLTIYDIHSPKDISHVIDKYEKEATKREETVVEDLPIMRKDGTIFYADIGSSHATIGRIHYLIGIFRDITERKRIQDALCESETHYRLLAENATDVIWTVGMDMRLTYVSPSVTMLLGFTAEEAMARTMQQAYTPEAFEKAMQIFAEEMAIESAGHGDPTRSRMLELELVHKDGNTVPVEGNFCALRDPTGKMIGILAILRDITERKRMEEALRDSEKRYRELSIVDGLTTLYNSRHFYFQLKIELDRSNRYEQPLTLLLFDIDNFKAFNDTYGHIEGDQVLLRLGQVVKRCLRQTDSAYRYGGEEFTILLPMTTSADGAVTAERIRTEFKKETFAPAPCQDVHMTLSIGLAQYKPQEEMKAFVHRVDQLMYQGKKNGKDRACSEL